VKANDLITEFIIPGFVRKEKPSSLKGVEERGGEKRIKKRRDY